MVQACTTTPATPSPFSWLSVESTYYFRTHNDRSSCYAYRKLHEFTHKTTEISTGPGFLSGAAPAGPSTRWLALSDMRTGRGHRSETNLITLCREVPSNSAQPQEWSLCQDAPGRERMSRFVRPTLLGPETPRARHARFIVRLLSSRGPLSRSRCHLPSGQAGPLSSVSSPGQWISVEHTT